MLAHANGVHTEAQLGRHWIPGAEQNRHTSEHPQGHLLVVIRRRATAGGRAPWRDVCALHLQASPGWWPITAADPIGGDRDWADFEGPHRRGEG